MEKREKYKRLIMFVASAFILTVLTLIFAYVWFHFYANKKVIRMTFGRGNLVIVGLYAIIVFLFYKVYGGFKVGYLRVF